MTADVRITPPLATYGGVEGVRVEVHDESTPYAYSNLFHLRLRIVARRPGDEEAYERLLERLGVAEVDRERVRDELLGSFEATALPYLLRSDFSRRFAEYRERSTSKVRRFPGGT